MPEKSTYYRDRKPIPSGDSFFGIIVLLMGGIPFLHLTLSILSKHF